MAKKEFKAGAYGVIAGILVAAILIGLSVFAFTSRYNAFSAEKIAQTYADSIVQTGDGYNALKVSLVSKNQKFGNFVIDAYMAPYVNDGDDVAKNQEIGTGSAAEGEMLDKVYNTMYDFFTEELKTIGLESYDEFYSTYFAKLKETRVEIIGDDYMDTEFMFGVFESNVNRYGESLTGTEEKLAADGKTVLKEASTGKYQELFGEGYKLTTSVADTKELEAQELEAYKAEYKSTIEAFIAACDDETKKESVSKLEVSEDINAVAICPVEVKDQNGNIVTSTEIYVVKIGNSWYVDNTRTDTTNLYIALHKVM